MIAQVFQPAETAEDLRCCQDCRDGFGFLASSGQGPAGHAGAGPQDIAPPKEKRLEQTTALLQVDALRERPIMVFTRLQPGAVRRVLVACLLLLERGGVFLLDGLPYLAEQGLDSLCHAIRLMDSICCVDR